MREQEIAQALNYERRTINNYLRELEIQGRVYKDGQLWYSQPYKELVLRPLGLQPEEAMVLYLAARLFVKQSDQRNETAELVLTKLADILNSDMGLERDLYQAARELAQRPRQPGYEDVFRTIMQAYIYRRKVQMIYHPYQGEPFATLFAPYLMEPSAIGFATYAIGHSSVVNALRTYKIERIEQVRLIQEEYEIPPDFPGLELLRSAWSIFYGEELTRVVLRFHPEVARRVQETNWHPSQQLAWDEEQPGYLRLTVEVASTIDLLPWIRGWGASCEVLEPARLRRALTRETRQLATLYGASASVSPAPTELLWAKVRKATGEKHLLVCHLIDVAQVALLLWTEVLSPRWRQQVADWLALDEEAAGRLLAFWIGLHDLGKASPAFQRKYEPAIDPLKSVGLTFPPPPPKSAPHGLVSAWALASLLHTVSGLNKQFARRVAHALGGHHGAWPTAEEMTRGVKTVDHGGDAWDAVRQELMQTLQAILHPPQDIQLHLRIAEENVLLTLLSGLATVADWIGSMEQFFEFEDLPLDPQEYAVRAAIQARQALEQTGWLAWQNPDQTPAFGDLFPNLPHPNDIQEAVIAAADQFDAPALIILEAPTGIGKTEAALYLADRLLQSSQGRGLYVAMPTQATSNQMFGRVHRFLAERYPEDLVNLQLLHGQKQWIEDFQRIQLASIYEDEADAGQGRVAALSWFLPRKRGLLAPFAVGTVDQALMSILLTKHFFVRLFGLSHKVVIFDEVHAYDTYMETLFHRLLEWLHRIGASVIILSATLPAQTKHKLLAAYLGESGERLDQIPYPSLTIATSQQVQAVPLPSPAGRTIRLEWLQRDPRAIVDCLASELRGGGCAAVICNTVGRAQEIYRALDEAQIVSPDELLLFHARFPFDWRQGIEQEVVSRFGKKGPRPARAIVVATQVVEQSLDLDFDLMITDLAPVDLILQRAGRLHRHAIHQRPNRLAEPRLLITAPDFEDDIPTFGNDAYVYNRFVLLASWIVLQARDKLTLPADTTWLIETVYSDTVNKALLSKLDDTWKQMLWEARQEWERGDADAKHQALLRVVHPPQEEMLLNQGNEKLEEDNPEIHQAFQALTRLSEPGVSIVCLFDTASGIAFDPDGEETTDLKTVPSPQQIKRLLQNTVTIQHKGVLRALLNREVPSGWKSIPALRHARLVIFEGGSCQLEGYTLRLSRQIGLEIKKETP